MKITKTHTGKIYSDDDRKLEFLTVGDYGKSNNIKADFLGFTDKILGVANTEVDLSDKWVATISTQKGCPMKCTFCDVHKYGFHGNATVEDLEYQIKTIIESEKMNHTNRFNVHYARMGEPSFNFDVLKFTYHKLDDLVRKCGLKAKTIHPVISTMMPKNNKHLIQFLNDWCVIKNYERNGEAGLQFSINSTDDNQRNKQFNNMSLDLRAISTILENLPHPIGRKYTLNFAVTNETILDVDVLNSLFSKDKFIVKLTPIHQTKSANENNYNVTTSYDDYDVYEQFEKPLVAAGWDVIVFIPSKEEDSDRITCGNSLLALNQ